MPRSEFITVCSRVSQLNKANQTMYIQFSHMPAEVTMHNFGEQRVSNRWLFRDLLMLTRFLRNIKSKGPSAFLTQFNTSQCWRNPTLNFWNWHLLKQRCACKKNHPGFANLRLTKPPRVQTWLAVSFRFNKRITSWAFEHSRPWTDSGSVIVWAACAVNSLLPPAASLLLSPLFRCLE